MIKKICLISVFLLILFGFTLPTRAIEFVSPDRDTGNSTLNQTVVVNDNFATAGNSVEINGEVKKDLIIAGNIVGVNGEVGNNLFATGNAVTISNNVNGDVFVGASNLKIEKNVTIKGNVIAASGNAQIDGLITGKIYYGGGTLEINGQVNGEITTNVGTLVIGPQAVINGKIIYSSQNDAKIKSGAQLLGGIEKKALPTAKTNQTIKSILIKSLFSLITALLLGVIILTLFPKYSYKISETIRTKFFLNLLLGIVVLIGLPLLVVVCFAIIIGIPIALILLALYILSMYLAKIYVGLALGNWLTKNKWEGIWALTIGLVILTMFGFIPYLKNVIGFIILLLGLGAIVLVTYQISRSKK